MQKYLASSEHAAKEGAIEFLDTIKLSKFIEGLRPGISFELQNDPPDNFENAVTMAKNMEIALNNKKPLEINNMETQNNSSIYDAILQLAKQHNEQTQEIKEQVNSP